MNGSFGSLKLSPGVVVALLACALTGGLVLMTGTKDYPDLHIVLDTGMFLLSAMLALLFWDMSTRIGGLFPRLLGISFAVTCTLEFLHVLVGVEWSGPLAVVNEAAEILRPATWPPPAYLLPIALGGSIWLTRDKGGYALAFAAALILVGLGLLVVFHRLPRYIPPGLLGITRPALILVPFLWMVMGSACWRLRAADRLLPALALMAIVLLAGHVFMLYSRAPHDTLAMVAHLAKVGGYLVLLLSLMQMASIDMLERMRAERKLAQANDTLERRVHERTAQLEAANESLEAEIAVRRQTEKQVEAQLERLNLLHQITRAIGERQDLQSIFQVVIRSLEDQLPVDFSCVGRYDQPGNALIVTSVGLKSEALAIELAMNEQARVSIDENGLSRCVHGQLVYEPDISHAAFPFPYRLAQGGLHSLVVAPLLAESRVFGVLVAARRASHSFSSGECEFLRQLSEHTALAAHQAQLYGALQQAYDDLRQTQQAMMQQERLGALGQMASGIAHDINNAISPVALYTESLLEKEPNLSARTREYLQTIQHAIEDVAQTVARMREFYRKREPQLTLAPVRLNRLIQQVMDLTRARWSDMAQQRGIVVQMVTELATDLPAVMGIESEIREALVNLVFNAVDAMPEGGSLTFRTKVVAREPGLKPESARQKVHVEVVDTGVGMDEDTQHRCLEPFFTTKGERGTGLGLAMVYGMVQRHSASIEIESTVGRGTIMRLSFAVAAATTESSLTEERYTAASRLRILVVDDDPMLLTSLRDILELDGHMVVSASGGQAGIDAFLADQERGESFAVVITDLGMPYVDGRKVVSAIKAASPCTPVILLTGWGERLVANGDVPKQADRVLNKPPKLRELREAFACCCPPEGS